MIYPIPFRGIRSDSEGDGHFYAPRGSHIHSGMDLVAVPGEDVVAPIGGKVRLGYCYSDDLSYRYVEISNEWYSVRVFYVVPSVSDGELLQAGAVIGVADDVRRRYGDKMTPHLHVEVAPVGTVTHRSWMFINPEHLFQEAS